MQAGHIGLAITAPRAAGGGAVLAPAVAQIVAPDGDSWTQCNEMILSRTGSSTPGDSWPLQLAAALSLTYYITPNQAGVTSGVINRGYGGQTSATILSNVTTIINNNPAYANNAVIHGNGKNDTSNVTGFSDVTSAWASLVALFPHDRQLIWAPQGTITRSVTASDPAGRDAAAASWVKRCRLRWYLRDTYPKYAFEIDRYWMGLYPNGSNRNPPDGTGDDLDVAGDVIPASEHASASTDQNHPNYLVGPLWATCFTRPCQAMLNNNVYTLEATRSVPFNMAAGQTLEVYCKGYATSCAIVSDDATLPGAFTIAMKPGSTDTALLTRTSSYQSGNYLTQPLNITVSFTGVDQTGAAVGPHTNNIRIVPGLGSSGVTVPRGASLTRDANATATSRRYPLMNTEGYLLGSASAPTKLTVVVCGLLPLTDGETQTLFAMGTTRLLVQRASTNRVVLRLKDSAGVDIFLSAFTSFSLTNATGPTNIAFSIDMNGGGAGVPAATFVKWASSGGNANPTPAPTLSFGTGLIGINALFLYMFSTSSNQPTFEGKCKYIWIDTGRVFDFTSAPQIAKFWDASTGAPVDLGSQGQVDGVQPVFYQPWDMDTLLRGQNWGSGPQMSFVDNWLLGYSQANNSAPKVY